MGLLLAALLAASTARAMSVDEIVRRAAENQRDSEQRSSLAFDAVEVSADLDSSGRAHDLERRVFACVRRGRSLERNLVLVDGRAATDRERRKSQAEKDEVKTGRLDLMDMLSRFDFRFLRDDVVDGRPAWLVAFAPRSCRPVRSAKDRVLAQFEGRAWIDTAELQVLRIDGHLARPVRFAGGVALRLDRIEIVYEARPVSPGIWAPCGEDLLVEAQAALVFPYRHRFRLEFANYRSATALAAGARTPPLFRSGRFFFRTLAAS